MPMKPSTSITSSKLNVRNPLFERDLPSFVEDDELDLGRAPFIDKVMQSGLDRLVTAFGP
jgi:hypothetical protein